MEDKKTLYICDRKKCKNCNPDCTHTTDINHAENFEDYGNCFVERAILKDLRSIKRIKKNFTRGKQ